jgi:hypothetical protein
MYIHIIYLESESMNNQIKITHRLTSRRIFDSNFMAGVSVCGVKGAAERNGKYSRSASWSFDDTEISCKRCIKIMQKNNGEKMKLED